MTKRISSITALIIIFIIPIGLFAQSNLLFQNGKFKIAQFTDLHWNNESDKCEQTILIIESVLQTEQPQLAILSGDVVTAPPAKDGWLKIAQIFERFKTPWTVVLGNHDAEADLSREGVFDLLQELPYFIGEKGNNLSGVGNFALNINNIDNNTSAILYFFDSHNKPEQNKNGHYDWIHFDQISWYRQQSTSFTQINGKPVPSLAFFHIPIPEYKDVRIKESTLGNKTENVSSPDINSGLFTSFVDMKDVMGAFVGHDHNNDYIGTHHDIALAFGRVSGADAYGNLERGARIIEMHEGKFQFDTWIRTPSKQEFLYYFPSRISSIDEETMTFLPELKNIKKGEQGIKYSYYEGGTLRHSSDILTKANLVSEGVIKNISIETALVPDSFAFVFEGLISIPEKEVYNFYTFSDDGSVLYIDDEVIVDNDGAHSLRRMNGKVALEKGLHKIKIVYFENYMGEFLEVGWSSKSIREETIPDHVLFTIE